MTNGVDGLGPWQDVGTKRHSSPDETTSAGTCGAPLVWMALHCQTTVPTSTTTITMPAPSRRCRDLIPDMSILGQPHLGGRFHIKDTLAEIGRVRAIRP